MFDVVFALQIQNGSYAGVWKAFLHNDVSGKAIHSFHDVPSDFTYPNADMEMHVKLVLKFLQECDKYFPEESFFCLYSHAFNEPEKEKKGKFKHFYEEIDRIAQEKGLQLYKFAAHWSSAYEQVKDKARLLNAQKQLRRSSFENFVRDYLKSLREPFMEANFSWLTFKWLEKFTDRSNLFKGMADRTTIRSSATEEFWDQFVNKLDNPEQYEAATLALEN